jgi:SAM-dependent methyltransferase
MTPQRSLDELLAEAASADVTGWGFSWLAGRATEERPRWGYSRLLTGRLASAAAVLDVQTGGAEVLAEAAARNPRPPALLAATESWPPNAPLAAAALRPLGGAVVRAADAGGLPFGDGAFSLVVSRHPTTTAWAEIARVLRPGGSYFSQQVGPGSNRELTDFLMGPQPVSQSRSPRRAVAHAAAAGLTVTDLREQTLQVSFTDIGAVVYFLRKVIWTVPGFTVPGYRQALARLHEQITADGQFTCYCRRFLIEAQKLC